MKSIIFAALLAIANAQFTNVANDNVTVGSSTAAEVTTDAVEATPVPDATAGVDTDRSDELIQTDDYEAQQAAWETDTKINTTDFKDNAAEKGEMDEFSWDSFDMSDFTFSDLLDLLSSDSQVQKLSDGVREQYMARYAQEALELPEVCEAGKECRRLIKEEAKQYISVEWQETMKSIKSIVTNTIVESRELLKEAYKAAFYCDGGCTCEFVEARYSHLVASYKEVESSISWYEQEISVRLGYFGELDDNCPHHDDEDKRAALDAEYEA